MCYTCKKSGHLKSKGKLHKSTPFYKSPKYYREILKTNDAEKAEEKGNKKEAAQM